MFAISRQMSVEWRVHRASEYSPIHMYPPMSVHVFLEGVVLIDNSRLFYLKKKFNFFSLEVVTLPLKKKIKTSTKTTL